MNNKLKELTYQHHKNAERQAFAKELISGNISKWKYATFLFNQHPQYNLLETFGMLHNLIDIRIAPKIHNDYSELWTEFNPNQPPLLPVVKEYMDHLLTIQNDPEKLMAHIYVRHMGDLSGGQIIARKVPGKATMYHFDQDVNVIKELIRNRCTDDMADEANLCFDFATQMFQQMAELNE